MPCENYREALIEAAAVEVVPSRELRSHLDACTSCRATFAEDTQLFAAINRGVRATANADVPASFLSRVRASLEDASASRRGWTPFLIFAATAAAIVLIVFIAGGPRQTRGVNQTKQVFSAAFHETPDMRVRREASEIPAVVAANGLHHTPQRRNSTSRRSAAPGRLQVLVPPDEREAFARFIEARQERSDVDLAAALVASASDKTDGSLSVEALQIAKLEVRPLESLAGEVPDGTEEEQ